MHLHVQGHTHESKQTGCFPLSSLPCLQLLPTNFRVQKKRFLQWTQWHFAELPTCYPGAPSSQHVRRGSCLFVHLFHQTGLPDKCFSCSPLHSRYQMNTHWLNNVLCQECPPTCPQKIPYQLKTHHNCLQRCAWSPPSKHNTYHMAAVSFQSILHTRMGVIWEKYHVPIKGHSTFACSALTQWLACSRWPPKSDLGHQNREGHIYWVGGPGFNLRPQMQSVPLATT